MKLSLKLFIGLISAASFVVGAGYSASAQTSSVDSLGNRTPGNSNSSSPYQNPGDRPTNQNPSISPNPDAVIGPANGNPNTPSRVGENLDNNTGNTDSTRTDRPGSTPGTTNDPSYNQQPSNQRPNTPNRVGENLDNNTGNTDSTRTDRPGSTPGTTNDPSYNQQPSNQRLNDQRNTPQSRIEAPSSSDSMSIDEIVSESPSFELFNALLRVANIEDQGLVESLAGDDSYVVYAPTDEAFAALPPDTIRTLVQPENRDLLVELLSYHIVPEDKASEDVPASTSGEASSNAEQAAPAVDEVDSPSQLSDSTSSFVNESSEFPTMRTDRASGSMMVNNARVIGSNIQASNGTIVPIDQVILPTGVQSELGELGLVPNYGTPSAISPNSTSPTRPGLTNPSQRPF
ncbi:MAG: fasciclin domain-containing protein [Oculatellaceae cyanobacterium bins.114]|nr:fasciclin domain-containing protein [Oculatellaceae cyanobacterium bins.114]